MRRSPISNAVAEEEDINLTPMLDVVFILLIFFIVTANFIKFNPMIFIPNNTSQVKFTIIFCC